MFLFATSFQVIVATRSVLGEMRGDTVHTSNANVKFWKTLTDPMAVLIQHRPHRFATVAMQMFLEAVDKFHRYCERQEYPTPASPTPQAQPVLVPPPAHVPYPPQQPPSTSFPMQPGTSYQQPPYQVPSTYVAQPQHQFQHQQQIEQQPSSSYFQALTFSATHSLSPARRFLQLGGG